MFPASPMNNAVDCRSGYSEAASQFGRRDAVVGSVSLPDVKNVLLGKFGITNGLAALHSFRVLANGFLLACGHAAFQRRIAVIVGFRAEPQVGRIYARWIVATVAYTKAVWNWAMRQLVRVSVCRHLPPSDHNLTMPEVGAGTSPNPALARFVNLRPKADGRIGNIGDPKSLPATAAAKPTDSFAKVNRIDMERLAADFANSVRGGKLGVHWSLLGFRAMPLGVSAPQGFLCSPIIQRVTNKNAHRSERVCTQALVGVLAAGSNFMGVEPNLLATRRDRRPRHCAGKV